MWRSKRYCNSPEEGCDLLVVLVGVNALCIDQSNIPERNNQVDQMGRIYSQALGVVAWI
jgi:hypothetical protein